MLMVYIIEMSTSPRVWEVCGDIAFSNRDEAEKYAKHLVDVSLGKLSIRVRVLTVVDKA